MSDHAKQHKVYIRNVQGEVWLKRGVNVDYTVNFFTGTPNMPLVDSILLDPNTCDTLEIEISSEDIIVTGANASFEIFTGDYGSVEPNGGAYAGYGWFHDEYYIVNENSSFTVGRQVLKPLWMWPWQRYSNPCNVVGCGYRG